TAYEITRLEFRRVLFRSVLAQREQSLGVGAKRGDRAAVGMDHAARRAIVGARRVEDEGRGVLAGVGEGRAAGRADDLGEVAFRRSEERRVGEGEPSRGDE